MPVGALLAAPLGGMGRASPAPTSDPKTISFGTDSNGNRARPFRRLGDGDAVLLLHAGDLGQALIADHAAHGGAGVLDGLSQDALVAGATGMVRGGLAKVVAHAFARVAAG